MIENSAAALETQKETQQAEGSQAVAGETKEGTLDLAADGCPAGGQGSIV